MDFSPLITAEKNPNNCDYRDSTFLQLKLRQMYLQVSLLLKLLESPHGGTDREAAKFLPMKIFRAELGKALSSPAWSGALDWRSAELPANLNYSMHL